nr:uncharacterized protein LOC107280945 [Oryza sativa Japonica Group]
MFGVSSSASPPLWRSTGRGVGGGGTCGRCWQGLVAVAATEGSLKSSNEADKQVPSWLRNSGSRISGCDMHPGSDEPPPWAHKGGNGGQQKPVAIQLPFYAYLLTSAITFIIVIGSIFEYVNQRPVVGVVSSDSALYVLLLGFFVFTSVGG